jgi:hypothetical protein
MSYRNSFCTEYIYDEHDEKLIFDKLSQHYKINRCSHIISGLISNTWCGSTPYDLRDVLDGVITNHPVTFVAISENRKYPEVNICVLEGGTFNISNNDIW